MFHRNPHIEDEINLIVDQELENLDKYLDILEYLEPQITTNEKMILDYLAQGYSRRDIAKNMNISVARISQIVKQIRNNIAHGKVK